MMSYQCDFCPIRLEYQLNPTTSKRKGTNSPRFVIVGLKTQNYHKAREAT